MTKETVLACQKGEKYDKAVAYLKPRRNNPTVLLAIESSKQTLHLLHTEDNGTEAYKQQNSILRQHWTYPIYFKQIYGYSSRIFIHI